MAEYTREQLEALSDADLMRVAYQTIDMSRAVLRKRPRKWLIDTILDVTKPIVWPKR